MIQLTQSECEAAADACHAMMVHSNRLKDAACSDNDTEMEEHRREEAVSWGELRAKFREMAKDGRK